MAKAEKFIHVSHKTVKREVIVMQPTTVLQEFTEAVTEEQYQLTLSKDEAQVMADLFANIGGSSDTTRRKFTDSVYNALYKVGVEYQTDSTGVDWKHNDPWQKGSTHGGGFDFLPTYSDGRRVVL